MRRAGGALVLAGIIGGAASTLGQTSAGGGLNGTVVDPSCGVLPGATVTARQLDGDLARTAVTSQNGRFTVDHLPAGDYALTASLAGFAAASRRSISLRDAETISSSLVLEPGKSGPARALRICVPVEMSRNVMIVRATLNDAPEPVWLILDSGASVSVVGEALATARGMTARAVGETRAGIGESSTRIGMIGQITVHVAGAEIATNNTVSLPLGDDFDVIGHQIDGVLGSDVFLKYVVRIDYAAASVTLFDANSFAYDGTGTTIPIALSGNTPNVNVTVTTGGTSLSTSALLDTGSDGFDWLHSSVRRQASPARGPADRGGIRDGRRRRSVGDDRAARRSPPWAVCVLPARRRVFARDARRDRFRRPGRHHGRGSAASIHRDPRLSASARDPRAERAPR